MGSQPNLASKSEVVSIYKCPQKVGGISPKFGAQKHQIFDHFFRDFRTRHRISQQRNVVSTTKILVLIYNVSPKRWPTSVTFDPETAEIRLLIVTHPSAAITLQPS